MSNNTEHPFTFRGHHRGDNTPLCGKCMLPESTHASSQEFGQTTKLHPTTGGEGDTGKQIDQILRDIFNVGHAGTIRYEHDVMDFQDVYDAKKKLLALLRQQYEQGRIDEAKTCEKTKQHDTKRIRLQLLDEVGARVVGEDEKPSRVEHYATDEHGSEVDLSFDDEPVDRNNLRAEQRTILQEMREEV